MFENGLNALHGFNLIPLQMYTSGSRLTAVELLLALACHQFAGYLLKLLIFSYWFQAVASSFVNSCKFPPHLKVSEIWSNSHQSVCFSLCTESMCKCHIVVYFLLSFAYRLHESILFTDCKRNKYRKSHAAISTTRAENQSKLHFTDLAKAGTIAGHDIICPHIAATLVR